MTLQAMRIEIAFSVCNLLSIKMQNELEDQPLRFNSHLLYLVKLLVAITPIKFKNRNVVFLLIIRK